MTRRNFIKAIGAGLLVASPLPVGLALAEKEKDMKVGYIPDAKEALLRLNNICQELVALELYFEDAGCTRFASSCFELDTLAELNLDSFKSVIEENQKSTTVQQIKEDMNEALYYYLDM